MNDRTNLATAKMKQLSSTFQKKGVINGVISGLTYGIFATLVVVARGCYDPATIASLGLLAVPFILSGLNDLFAGIWLLIYIKATGRLAELGRTLKTKPGKIMIIGFLLGGPVANGTFLISLQMAGAYAIPISATTGLFGALFAWIFLKQKPTKRIVVGMFVIAAGAVILNLVKPEGAEQFTLGVIFATVAAIAWGLEGVFASFGGSMLDADVVVNLRQLISGITTLLIAFIFASAFPLFIDTFIAVTPVIWLAIAGFSAAVSFLTWYKSNTMVGVAIGSSLNVTYTFWGVLFSIMFLGQEITFTIITGSIIIFIGSVLVAMNPLDLFKKKEN